MRSGDWQQRKKKAQKAELEQKMQEKQAAAEAAREAALKAKAEKDEKKIAAAAKKTQQDAEERERRAKMTPEELQAEEERAESERQQRADQEAKMEEERKRQMESQAEANKLKLEAQERRLKDEDGKFKFVFYGGKMHTVRIDAATPNAKGGGTAGGGGRQPGQPAPDCQDSGKGSSKASGKGSGSRPGHASSTRASPTLFEGSIDVPRDLIGRLIGKGGATIKELCVSTGAIIDIPKDKHGHESAGVVSVAVRGGKKAVDDAVQRITELLGT